MNEIVGPIALIALLAIFFYYFDGWYNFIDQRKNPRTPYPDELQIIGRTATIVHDFSPPMASQLRVGKVEVNGVIWSAETSNVSCSLTVGDKVTVVDRDGLTLIVAEWAAS